MNSNTRSRRYIWKLFLWKQTRHSWLISLTMACNSLRTNRSRINARDVRQALPSAIVLNRDQSIKPTCCDGERRITVTGANHNEKKQSRCKDKFTEQPRIQIAVAAKKRGGGLASTSRRILRAYGNVCLRRRYTALSTISVMVSWKRLFSASIDRDSKRRSPVTLQSFLWHSYTRNDALVLNNFHATPSSQCTFAVFTLPYTRAGSALSQEIFLNIGASLRI